MGQWVVTVAGIAILSVLCDIILPEGQTRKYVKTVFGVVVTFVIVQPLIGLFDKNDVFTQNDIEWEVQYRYLDSVKDRELNDTQNRLLSQLKANGIEVQELNVSDGTVEVRLPTTPSAETEAKVKAIVAIYFPEYAVRTVWV